MSNSFSSNAVTLLFSFALLATLGVPECKAEWRKLTEFRDLYSVARRLESADRLVDTSSRAKQNELQDLYFAFVRELKSTLVHNYYQQRSKIVADYRLKASQFIDDTQKQRSNWFTNMMTLGGPMGSMRSISKSDSFLSGVTERYAKDAKSIDTSVVEKDLAKFQILGISRIFSVLAIDIKYLAIKNVQFVNIATFDKLKEEKFVVHSDIYQHDRLSEKQKKLLRDFYVSRVDLSKVTVGEALEHIEDPGNFKIGRLLDSCRTLQQYQSTLQQLIPTCGKDCEPKGEFITRLDLERYDDFNQFCGAFIETE